MPITKAFHNSKLRPTIGEYFHSTVGAALVMFYPMDYLRARVIVRGFVQGVAFRASTRNQAERLGVGGWVRNLSDGTVESLFEGELQKVEEIVAWCHRGPFGSHVTEVEIVWEPYQGEYCHFDIRYDR